MRLAIMFFILASIAKADGFNPADVYPGQTVYDFTLQPQQIRWAVAVLDTQPAGADFWGICVGYYPYCTTDNPIGGFEAAGSTFDIAVDIFGFDPGLYYTQAQGQAAILSTPEPSTWLLILPAFLLIGLKRLLWKD